MKQFEIDFIREHVGTRDKKKPLLVDEMDVKILQSYVIALLDELEKRPAPEEPEIKLEETP